MLGSVRRTAGILLVATALLVVPGCSPLQADPYIGLLREGNQFTLLVMYCDQSTVEDLSFGTGEGLGGEVQTQLTSQFDVSPQETVEFELNGLVPPSTTRDSAPQFPFFTVVRFSDGISRSRFEVAPPDGRVAFMREDQQPTAGTRKAFVENVEMYCQKTAGNVG